MHTNGTMPAVADQAVQPQEYARSVQPTNAQQSTSLHDMSTRNATHTAEVLLEPREPPDEQQARQQNVPSAKEMIFKGLRWKSHHQWPH